MCSTLMQTLHIFTLYYRMLQLYVSLGSNFRHKNNLVRIQKLPAFVAMNTAGDVQASPQKYQFFDTRNKSVNYLEVSLKYIQLCHACIC